MVARFRQWLQRLRAYSVGSAATTRDTEAVAAETRGVSIQGNVQTSVIVTGDGNIIHHGSAPRDSAVALAAYCRTLAASCRHLPLRGVDIHASDPTENQRRLDLAQVYIALRAAVSMPRADADLRQPGERQARSAGHTAEDPDGPRSVLDMVVSHQRLVLLGHPGSGKSTFLNHLGLCLAAHTADSQAGWLARLPGWPAQAVHHVPILVVLRDFARWLSSTGVTQAAARHLWDFIETGLAAQNLAHVAEPLQDALDHGHAVLLLDGLDEIPTSTQRALVRDAVAACATRYPLSRLVVTCRTFSYQDPAAQLPDLPAVTLAPFDEEQIDNFIAAWYTELTRMGALTGAEATGLAQRLGQAVHRPDLWRLAPNPLLLTVMALVHTHRNRLPEARALLYEETVNFLLWHWEELKFSSAGDVPRLRSLLEQAERTDTDLRGVLWRLAFEAHHASGEGDEIADIGEWQLQKALIALHPDKSRDWAHQMLETMKTRAGLLLERAPEVYAFPHRTFQEYLAGAYLCAQGNFAWQATQLAATGAAWREVVLLGVGRLVHVSGDTDKPLALVGELCPEQPVATEVAWRQAWLAGDVLLEMGRSRVRDSALGQDLDERVRRRLVALLRTSALSPVERAAAGNTLARLGDPRFRAAAWSLPDGDLLGFVEIPAGPFLMGNDKQHDALAYDDEAPQHTVIVPRYYIARYPVTVTQFQAFVEASSYMPAEARCLQGVSNHPVVYVTWHDALAYCDWLTMRLREWPATPAVLADLLSQEGWRVTLPSEAEWEKAARGPDGRRYPWGHESDPRRANYDGSGIDTTNTVGCFPGGASPYGVEETSGNVWEWTRSLWGPAWDKLTFPYPYKPDDGREQLQAPDDIRRVVRGGGFWYVHQCARCAYRRRAGARDVDYDIGFRVVVRPCL